MKKLYLLLAGFLAALTTYLVGRQSGKDKVNKDNALHQIDVLNKAHTQGRKARSEAEEDANEALKKADAGDWSGFNDKL